MINIPPVSITRALTALFYLYGGITAFLGMLLNRHLLVFFSIDNELSAPTITRIHHAQSFFLLAGAFLFVAGLWVKAKKIGGGFSARKLNIFLSISVLVFILFCVESVLSIKFPGRYLFANYTVTPLAIDDRNVGYVLNPNLDHSFEINSFGFRGEEIAVEKKSDEIRIIAVGDSITFGWPLNDETSTYPFKLEKSLEKINNGKIYNVINAGVPGYTSVNVLNFITHRVLPMKPDFIIMCIGWNDLIYAYNPEWHLGSLINVSDINEGGVFSPAIFQAAKYVKSRLRYGAKRSPNKLALESFQSNLIEIVKIAHQNDISLLVLNMPAVLSRKKMTVDEIQKAGTIPEIDDLALYQNAIDEICEDMNVPKLDIFGLEMPAKGAYFVDFNHPNSEGTTFIVKQIIDFVNNDDRLRGLIIKKM